jgi:hypothetical protein
LPKVVGSLQRESDSADAFAGGADPWTYKKLGADYINGNNTTFVTMTDGTVTLTFTPPANTDWELEGRILIETTTIANLPRVGVLIPASATGGYGAVNLWQAGATANASVHANGTWKNNGAAVNVQIPAGGVLTANVPWLCEIIASGRSGAAPGTIAIQLANETAGANIGRALRGSFLKYRTI